MPSLEPPLKPRTSGMTTPMEIKCYDTQTIYFNLPITINKPVKIPSTFTTIFSTLLMSANCEFNLEEAFVPSLRPKDLESVYTAILRGL